MENFGVLYFQSLRFASVRFDPKTSKFTFLSCVICNVQKNCYIYTHMKPKMI
ncbi:hypothetical protein Bca101_082824 [Brassica carinata]